MNIFADLPNRQAAKYGDREQLRYRDRVTDAWTSMSWNALRRAVERVAVALYDLNLEEQGRLCLFTQNCPEIFVTHFAAFYNRAVPVPIYATSSRDEAAYIINDSGASVLLVGDQAQYDISRELWALCPTLNHVIVLDPRVQLAADDDKTLRWSQLVERGDAVVEQVAPQVEKRRLKGRDCDLMYLIYTSGTTGMPKGVMLTHSNFDAAMVAHIERIPVDDEKDISLSFLPLSHVFELGWSMVCFMTGVRVAINLIPKEIQKTVKEIGPTCMCSVPRFWEKVYTAINDKLEAGASWRCRA